MQLTITTDYAIRTVLYLATTETVKSIKEISVAMEIPYNYLPKIIKKLKSISVLGTKEGATGGVYLAKKSQDITLKEIIYLMEPKVKINRCLESDECCSRQSVGTCPVNKVYVDLQKQIDDFFDSITIKDLLENEIN